MCKRTTTNSRKGADSVQIHKTLFAFSAPKSALGYLSQECNSGRPRWLEGEEFDSIFGFGPSTTLIHPNFGKFNVGGLNVS